MDNDALMRRISAATDVRKAQAAQATQSAQAAQATQAPRAAQPALRRPEMRQPVPRQPVANVPQQQHQARVESAQPATPQPQQRSQPQQAAQAPVQPQNAPGSVATQPVPAPVSQPAPAMTAPTAVAQQINPAQPAIEPSPLSDEVPADGQLLSFKPEVLENLPPQPAPRPMRKEDRSEAYIIACNGNNAIVQGHTGCIDTVTGLTWAVGRMLSIHVGNNRVVGMICDIRMPEGEYNPADRSTLHFELELQGEVQDKGEGEEPKFVKGITSYPGAGSVVHQIRVADLASIYAATGSNNGVIGHLSQDKSIPAYVDIPDMLSKHFAVVGSTGCGKSASVSLLLHAAQELVPDLRTVILDPHNEYSRAFPGAHTIAQSNLDLPFWMLQLEEYVEVLFRGKPIVHEEVDALREFIPDAKMKFRDGEDRVKLRTDNSAGAITADTACPYRIADLTAMIDDEMGLLESRYDNSILKSLKARVQAHCGDKRYAFMFRHKTIEDIAQHVISDFFCLPGNGSYTTIIQMAGMPAEVVNAVASVLCRLSFELAIAAKGNLKVLVVCEEAHRYVPAGTGGFEPTRRAIARIAKEGRKYGSFMAIVSQRPSELDPTILSQCSTVFSLRLTNNYDQEIIRKAISSSSESTVAFISSLSNRECIAFGEGMSTPMRMRFRDLPYEWLPGAEADVFGNANPVMDPHSANNVFRQWRAGVQ